MLATVVCGEGWNVVLSAVGVRRCLGRLLDGVVCPCLNIARNHSLPEPPLTDMSEKGTHKTDIN